MSLADELLADLDDIGDELADGGNEQVTKRPVEQRASGGL